MNEFFLMLIGTVRVNNFVKLLQLTLDLGAEPGQQVT